jgi:hypothetical protein
MAHTPGMPTPRREDLVEVTITATLFSIYAGARGTARALGFMQLFVR